jgi:hypothetical protein
MTAELINFLKTPSSSLGFERVAFNKLNILKINVPDPYNLENDLPTIYSILKSNNECNLVVFSSSTEVFNYEYMKIITHNAYHVNNIKNILFFDNGFNESPIITEWIPENVHHIENTVTGLIVRTVKRQDYDVDEDIIGGKDKVIGPEHVYFIDHMKNVDDRNTKFVCLNKAPRKHRVRLVEEIISRNLHEIGTVSCGYDSINVDYSKICVQGLQHHFPLQVETTKRITDDSDVNETLSNFNEDSLITVVAETSCEQNEHPLDRGGADKIFITEKTLKAFITGTFPLILAPKHAIRHLRHRGFDMFDDLIDHSYDNYSDPKIKIKLIVDELEKLLEYSLQDLKDLHKKFIGRINANRHNCIHYCKNIEDNVPVKFKNYLDNIKL